MPEATLVVCDHSSDFRLDITRSDGARNSENLVHRADLFLVDSTADSTSAAVHSAFLGFLFGHFSLNISLVENFLCCFFHAWLHGVPMVRRVYLIVEAACDCGVINVGDEGAVQGVDALKVDCLGLNDVGEREGEVLGVRVRHVNVAEGRLCTVVLEEEPDLVLAGVEDRERVADGLLIRGENDF